MTFAVANLPILAGAGVAVDFARIATKHTSLQQATDAASLAIAQSATASTTNGEVMAQAQLPSASTRRTRCSSASCRC
jgi:Flp pilus assembly protein TadG